MPLTRRLLPASSVRTASSQGMNMQIAVSTKIPSWGVKCQDSCPNGCRHCPPSPRSPFNDLTVRLWASAAAATGVGGATSDASAGAGGATSASAMGGRTGVASPFQPMGKWWGLLSKTAKLRASTTGTGALASSAAAAEAGSAICGTCNKSMQGANQES